MRIINRVQYFNGHLDIKIIDYGDFLDNYSTREGAKQETDLIVCE